jgi:hypothetical protein
MSSEKIALCEFCGSQEVIRKKYLRLNSRSSARNFAYALPIPLTNIISKMHPILSSRFSSVISNKKFFTGEAQYCLDCCSGLHVPKFNKRDLVQYYRDFYWHNRDMSDGQHLQDRGHPNDLMIEKTSARYDWIINSGASFSSVADIGAGDCAAAYFFNTRGIDRIHVVDPSAKSEIIATQHGFSHSFEILDLPKVDLIFGSHVIEHVANVFEFLQEAFSVLSDGGYIFIETPNIGDADVFLGLVHTPHTYFLSKGTFLEIEKKLPFKIIKMEACGPRWSCSHPRVSSLERADLRVLLQKVPV